MEMEIDLNLSLTTTLLLNGENNTTDNSKYISFTG